MRHFLLDAVTTLFTIVVAVHVGVIGTIWLMHLINTRAYIDWLIQTGVLP